MLYCRHPKCPDHYVFEQEVIDRVRRIRFHKWKKMLTKKCYKCKYGPKFSNTNYLCQKILGARREMRHCKIFIRVDVVADRIDSRSW